MIDLRSDTVTKPTEGMLQAMTKARLGDDVFEEDPTVNAFQDEIASKFGFEAGLFVPSGVMGNQIALKLLTVPGDEVIIEEKGHIFNYESASAALISSVQLRPVAGSKGKLDGDLITAALRLGRDWEPSSRMVVIENSTNKGGGTCYTKNELEAVAVAARRAGLSLHIDGARIWNAMQATEIKAEYFGEIADTMTVSFSKGLGAPAGSMVLGRQNGIKKARRIRKMLGGGMRQIGLLAAAAGYAVDYHYDLLQADHRRAQTLARTINTCGGLSIDMESVETNILIFDVMEGTAQQAVEKLQGHDVALVPFGPETLRATFHFGISDTDLANVQSVFKQLFG